MCMQFILYPDRELETVDTGLSVMVILIVICSLVYTVLCIVFGVFVMLVSNMETVINFLSIYLFQTIFYKNSVHVFD